MFSSSILKREIHFQKDPFSVTLMLTSMVIMVCLFCKCLVLQTGDESAELENVALNRTTNQSSTMPHCPSAWSGTAVDGETEPKVQGYIK